MRIKKAHPGDEYPGVQARNLAQKNYNLSYYKRNPEYYRHKVIDVRGNSPGKILVKYENVFSMLDCKFTEFN